MFVNNFNNKEEEKMISKKSIYFIIISIILILLYTLRIITININFPKSKNVYYSIGETVPIENNFFDSNNEKMNGYSLNVIDTSLLSMNEFNDIYKIKNINNTKNYVYLIKIEFENTNNNNGTNSGIDLNQYILQETSYITYVSPDYFKYINNFNSLRFALKENSKKEFIIPFEIITQNVDIKQIINGSPNLIISLYPEKKIINVKN